VQAVSDGSRTADRLLKRPSNEAGGESQPEAYPQGYVEDYDEPRTKLEDFFSSLLQRPVSVARWAHIAGHAHLNRSDLDGTVCSRGAVQANGLATQIPGPSRIVA
jgi:hypothetical protein